MISPGVRSPLAEAALVEVEGLGHVYQDAGTSIAALHSVDLQVRPAELTAVMGRTGSGKTTLLGILAGLEVPTSGRVTVAGHDLRRLSRRQRRAFRRRVAGYVWQEAERGLVPFLSVLQNVLLPMLAEPGSQQQRVAYALQLLEALRLRTLAGSRLSELTAAETQRLAVAVALANRPLLLLADELTAVLDWPAAGELMGDLVRLLKSTATAAVLVSHDRRVQRFVDQVVVIQDGVAVPALETASAAGARR